MTTCPDCHLKMTVHSLKYTHNKYCKAKKITTEPIKIDENKPLDDIEEIVPKRESGVGDPTGRGDAPSIPPGLERAVSRIANVVPIVQYPSADQIAIFLNKKKALMTKKTEKYLY